MNRVLRGHHLLCVHGFRGMGYSEAFADTMAEIVKEICDETIDFPIQVQMLLDDACAVCPHNGGTICAAGPQSEDHVTSMDRRVLNKLGLQPGGIYSKSHLVRLTAEKIQADDLDHICAGCSWLSYGVCKEGIENLRRGNILQQ